MDTEGRTTAETPDEATEHHDLPTETSGRPVRVSYEPRGFGVALVVDEEGSGGIADDDTAGLLRVSDAVVTLEIPLPDGGRSILSWDPAEVSVDPLAS